MDIFSTITRTSDIAISNGYPDPEAFSCFFMNCQSIQTTTFDSEIPFALYFLAEPAGISGRARNQISIFYFPLFFSSRATASM